MSEATLVSVGDFAPLRSVDTARSPGVWDLLRGADLTIANLELPLTGCEATADKAITLRASPEIAALLPEFGIDLVTVANNHALDCGERGLLDTLEALEGAGIRAVGGGRDVDEALGETVVSIGETRIAVIGAASTLPPGFAAGENRTGIAPVRVRSRLYLDSVTQEEQPGMSPWVETECVPEDVERICAKVSEARERSDLVVVQMHWGIPNGWCAAFQGPLADYQRPLAHALVDAGASLVIGNHAHVVHGVERYGEGVIAYSLGNFLFHSMGDEGDLSLSNRYPPYDLTSLSTGLARQAVILEADLSESRLQSVRFVPVVMNERGEPEFSVGEEARETLGALSSQSEVLDTRLVSGEGEACLSLGL